MTAVAPPPTQRPRRGDRERALILVGTMVAVMWATEIVDAAGAHLDDDGIRPRDVDGLLGVLFAPFLHGGFGHLFGNTVPFLVLGAVIALGGLVRVLSVTVIVGLVSGLGVWLLAPSNSVTIGASGVVFGFATYLLARGFYSRRMLHLGVGVLVLLVWGTTLLFGLVPTPGVSWQAHLFGAVGGVLAARVLHGRDAAEDARPAALAT